MNYFNINSGIFAYDLSPSALMVFCAVSSIKNQLSVSVCKAEKLAKRTGLSERTVYRALESLQKAGLLAKHKRYRYDGMRAANGYYVAPVSGGKIKVERAIWTHQLDASSFAVYLFMVKKMNNNRKEAYPSLNVISSALKVCKNTVIAAVRKLQDRCVIFKEWQPRKNGGFCCNRHIILDAAKALLDWAKEKERTAMRSFGVLRSSCATRAKRYTRVEPICIVAQVLRVFKRAKAILRKFIVFLQSG